MGVRLAGVARSRAASAGTLALALWTAAGGCYTYAPLPGTAPAPGTRVALDITDRGRVALGGRVGPEVARIEGTLVEAAGDQYVIGVSRVETIRGEGSTWTGERVEVQQEHVARVRERRFSKRRSLIAAGAAMAAVGAFIVTRTLIGGGGGGSDAGGGPGPPEQ